MKLTYADAGHADREELARVLSEEELTAVRRFALPELRDRALLRRAFARIALGRALSVPPSEVRITKGRRGMPELSHAEQLSLSLSHTDDVALLALGRGVRVGVDIERFAAAIDPDLLSKMVLAKEEATAIAPLAGDARKRFFLRIWCRKESALKVTGIGLLDDLTTLSVLPEKLDLGACPDPRVQPDDAVVVTLQDLAIGDAHQGALATASFC